MPGQQVAPEATEDRGVKYVPGFSVFLSPIEQLHSGRANKRKAILNFSFPLEGNAIKLRILQIFSNRKLLRACGFIMQQNHNKSSHIFNKNY